MLNKIILPSRDDMEPFFGDKDDLLIYQKTRDIRDIYINGNSREAEEIFAKDLLPLLIKKYELSAYFTADELLSCRRPMLSGDTIAQNILALFSKMKESAENTTILLSGETGSGKSTLLNYVQEKSSDIVIVCQDRCLVRPNEHNPRYYFEHHKFLKEARKVVADKRKKSKIVILEGSRIIRYQQIRAISNYIFHIKVDFKSALFDLLMRNIIFKGIKPKVHAEYLKLKIQNGNFNKKVDADFCLEPNGDIVAISKKAKQLAGKPRIIYTIDKQASSGTVLERLLINYHDLHDKGDLRQALEKIEQAITICEESSYFALADKLYVIMRSIEDELTKK